ncbi:MAG: DDE-type integrase/transposase/recombinase [Pelomonas sp.]|nr:DDE-type integrase/transposase/recombinase [Roseateles sp.]
MPFTLRAGLTFRRGGRTLEVIRELTDGTLAIEDCVTRRPGTILRHKLLKLVWSGEATVIGADAASPASNETAAPALVTLDNLNESQRKELELRDEYVTAVRKAHLSRGMRRAIEALIKKVAERRQDAKPPSASSVMEWMRRFETSDNCAIALVSRNANRRCQSRLHPVMQGIVESALRSTYLTRDCHSLSHTLAVIHAEAKRKVIKGQLPEDRSRISLSTLTRRVQAMDAYRVIEARQGSARARMECRTTMDGTTAAYPLDAVEVDHTPLNWVVICDRTGLPLGRPMLTVVIDAYSNYLLGLYVSFYGPGLSSVSGAMRCAISPKADMVAGIKLEHRWLAEGIPDRTILDNGLEFHSPVFQRIGWELGSDFTYCRVRTPWLKPHVERFFATLDTLTLTKGRIHKRVANVLNIDPTKDASVMFSQFVRGLVMFAVDVHPFQINERKLAKPYDLFLEGLERTPAASFPHDMGRIRLASALSKLKTVDQGGVELHGLPYGGAELLPMRERHGKRFKTWVKWDPDDMSQLWVQDPADQRWVSSPCRWGEYATNLSWNQHLLIRKFARQELKQNGSYEYLEKARLRLHDHWMEAVAWKTQADRKLAARFSGATSAKVFAGDLETPAPPPPPEPVSEQEVKTYAPADAAEFETVDL